MTAVPKMGASVPKSPFPSEDAERAMFPMWDGLIAYFPSALAGVARVSKEGNEKHNPGQPMHHARGKSTDHLNKVIRHLMEGDYDAAAWRVLALSQEWHEANGAPMAPGARPAAPRALNEAPPGSIDAHCDELLPPGTPPQAMEDA